MKTARLGDLVSICGGGTPRKSVGDYYGGGIPWVTPKDMKRPVIGTSEITLTNEGVANSPAKLVPAGSVLVVVRSGVLKHTLPVALTTGPVTLNQDMKALVPTGALDSAYLARLLRARQTEILGWVRATTADNFPVAKLLDLKLNVPPLDEQRRIAAILDQADAIRTKRRQTLTHLDTLTQSVFHAMFGDPSEWTRRWRMGRIGDIAVSVQYGTSAKAGDSGDWSILRMGNITDTGTIDLSDIKYIDLTESDIPKYTVRRGDMLFNRTNSVDKVGKTAIVRTDEPFAFAGYLVRVRFELEQQAEFVSTYLGSGHGRAVRKRLAKAAVNQANINASEMRRIPIALPPAKLYGVFADRIAEARTHRADVECALAADDELFASLQSRAFRGEF